LDIRPQPSEFRPQAAQKFQNEIGGRLGHGFHPELGMGSPRWAFLTLSYVTATMVSIVAGASPARSPVPEWRIFPVSRRFVKPAFTVFA
jgi:hypothetical protein